MKNTYLLLLIAILLGSCNKDSDSSNTDATAPSCGCDFDVSDLANQRFTPILYEAPTFIDNDFCPNDYWEIRLFSDCLTGFLTQHGGDTGMDCSEVTFFDLLLFRFDCDGGNIITRSDIGRVITIRVVEEDFSRYTYQFRKQ